MQPEIEESRRCPSCDALSPPEMDGDLIYNVCPEPECGHEFGWRRVLPAEPLCPAGLPLSAVAGNERPPGESVFLGTTIKRRPE